MGTFWVSALPLEAARAFLKRQFLSNAFHSQVCISPIKKEQACYRQVFCGLCAAHVAGAWYLGIWVVQT